MLYEKFFRDLCWPSASKLARALFYNALIAILVTRAGQMPMLFKKDKG